MTAKRSAVPASATEPQLADTVGIDALAEAALRLLEAMPQRPERLRVVAGDLAVDMDWRIAPVRAVAAGDMPAAPAAVVTADEDSAAVPAPAAQPASQAWHQVCAPTVGTFYHAPSPGAAPFVTEGDLVAAGQQVGIVEAMKLMVPVESDRAGRVVSVHIADGKPVEYGEPLISLGPVDSGPA